MRLLNLSKDIYVSYDLIKLQHKEYIIIMKGYYDQ